MAYVVPTIADFKARFPRFAAVSDAVVQSALDEAALAVDDTWASQADFTLGRLLYAAHVLTLDGQGTSTEAQLAGFNSIKMGSLSLTLEKRSGDSSALEATSYGRRFLALLGTNSPMALVV